MWNGIVIQTQAEQMKMLRANNFFYYSNHTEKKVVDRT